MSRRRRGGATKLYRVHVQQGSDALDGWRKLKPARTAEHAIRIMHRLAKHYANTTMLKASGPDTLVTTMGTRGTSAGSSDD